ncbi:HAMP domain-containing sensor histidine kinase [Neobacillus niacini]|uniref:sensor histidine kinase n=1 Tax=Neobacillus niacini TaxID=86668 RepID=UPI002860C270|nr:HAMP domain-containing sensor histidine kinase [Neobacillus niacini]MDR6999937.1 signal transduction histidine kinase [Neobacillus niacini]
MGTKWKNKVLIGLWAILITFGISGLFIGCTTGDRYISRDYFNTSEFQSELDQFTEYLTMFELNPITLKEAKESIKVTKNEIDEYRYRYGSLFEQKDNIVAQYEPRIEEAKAADDQVTVDSLTEERDKKVQDITNNFKSDEYFKEKIVKEKEKKIEEYLKVEENHRADYQRYLDSFLYYFKSSQTGKVYTNLDPTQENRMNRKEMKFLTNYTTSADHVMYSDVPGFELMNSIADKKTEIFVGKIALPKTLSAGNWLMMEAEKYKKQRIILLVYVISSIAALILGYFIRKKSKGIQAEIERYHPYYDKLPIDVRAAFFVFSCIGFILSLFATNDEIQYVGENPISSGRDVVIFLIAGAVFSALILLQWNYLISVVKDWKTVKAQLEKALLIKMGNWIKVIFKKTAAKLREAFLNQTAATQVFILLAAAFGLGLAAVLVVVQPIFLPFYLILVGVSAIPIVVMLVNRMAYLNQIVEKTNELASGKMGKDLQVSGKSVLATLAGNINVLKQGVKTSQNAQAKSERLKTELITNVSHDLRTPLTSIITYTQLLKTEEVSSEDRSAYLEIIDRKSKRLKVLIDDLFEVSKMASGNMDLKKEKVDLVQLLQQALGEYDDMINDSSLQFRVTNTEKPIYAIVDGQKLWRVFDNLIGNILKYSLENSRVFITISKLNGQAMITFKNVSKYELNDNSDELFERFKRGDTSRHTNGSGLGLAIAKSIVDLHEGSLDIETDGDLFKVSISLWFSE